MFAMLSITSFVSAMGAVLELNGPDSAILFGTTGAKLTATVSRVGFEPEPSSQPTSMPIGLAESV